MVNRFVSFAVACLSCAVASGDEKAIVVLLGDSTTLSRKAKPGLGYADWVAEFLEAEGASDFQVVNAGIEGALVGEGRKRAKEYLERKPAVIAVSFGHNDAVRSAPEVFRRDLEGLIRDIREASAGTRILLATSTPFDSRHARARDERFEAAGGLDRFLEKNFVNAVREIARTEALLLVDQHALIQQAVKDGAVGETFIRLDGVHLTARGNFLAGKHTALWILHAT